MNNIIVKTKAVGNHIKTNRAKYATLVTASAFIALQFRNAKIMNEFLDKHGLTEEFYATEDED